MTHAYTIDLVPVVLEKTCFAGHTSGEPSKRRNQAKHKADSGNQISKKEKKAHLNAKYGPSTDVAMAQAHPGTNHAKAVARRTHPGTGAPRVRPHPCGWLLGPACIDRCMAVCYGGLA